MAARFSQVANRLRVLLLLADDGTWETMNAGSESRYVAGPDGSPNSHWRARQSEVKTSDQAGERVDGKKGQRRAALAR
ncbi:MAG: hypothetical protein R3B91_15575 [Planctomycetaceae bacterium]